MQNTLEENKWGHSSLLQELKKEVEGKYITYEQGLEMCGCEQKYSCNFKKGHNQALTDVLALLDARIRGKEGV
jgi:hypothetical protein